MASAEVHVTASNPPPSFEDGLASEITAALKQTGYADLAGLEVVVDGHEVCLRGSVSSLYHLHKAEFVVMNMPSVSTFRSEIKVTG